jgi:hypothetical protein
MLGRSAAFRFFILYYMYTISYNRRATTGSRLAVYVIPWVCFCPHPLPELKKCSTLDPFLAINGRVSQPPAGSGKDQQVAVVYEPVDNGSSHLLIVEHPVPFAEFQVCGDDDALGLIAF